jgi:hypothetical protein
MRNLAISIQEGYGLGNENQGFDSQQSQDIFSFFMAFTPVTGCTQTPAEFILSLKQVGCHNYYSSASSTEEKNVYSYTPTHTFVFIMLFFHWHKDNYLTHVTYPGDRQKGMIRTPSCFSSTLHNVLLCYNSWSD